MEQVTERKAHADESILSVFKDIHAGILTNASFSDANVVMLSKEYYSALLERIEELEG